MCGYLDPHEDARFIIINRNQPHCEQVFTIAHELAHYLLHHKTRRFPTIAVLIYLVGRMSKSKRATNFSHRIQQFVRKIFELEADLNAMCTLINSDAMDDIKNYLKRHPEKKLLFIFANFAIAVARIDGFINL